jgi:hypothetical protein
LDARFNLQSGDSQAELPNIHSHHVVSKIVRVVELAINGTSHSPAKTPASEKKLFLLSVHRLADSPWFSPQLIVQGLDEAKARKHLVAAQALLSRLHEIIWRDPATVSPALDLCDVGSRRMILMPVIKPEDYAESGTLHARS